MSLFRFGPGPAEAWGAEGAIRLPLQIFLGIEKRTHEEREIFFYFAPQIFEPSAGSVCCCAISTYCYIRYQVRFEFKVEHSKSFYFPCLHIKKKRDFFYLTFYKITILNCSELVKLAIQTECITLDDNCKQNLSTPAIY